MMENDEIKEFEGKLENSIKSAFGKIIDDEEDFEISADQETHTRINRIVKKLDLRVHGMAITPSNFIITFEFSGSYRQIDSKEQPRYCKIYLRNDGRYDLTLDKDYLKEAWYLSITDAHFNLKTVPEEVMMDCLRQLNNTLLLKVLSS